MSNHPGRREFGAIRKLPGGQFQASYQHPSDPARRVTARRPDGGPQTFRTKSEAADFLDEIRHQIRHGTWSPPPERKKKSGPADAHTVTFAAPAPAGGPPRTFASFAEWYVTNHRKPDGEPLSDHTRNTYRSLIRNHLAPTFGEMRLEMISDTDIRIWHDAWQPVVRTGSRSGASYKQRSDSKGGLSAHAYAYRVLRAILGSARRYKLIAINPADIRGAGREDDARDIPVASAAELAAAIDAMPDRLKLWAVLAGWFGLRFQELAELRRQDFDLARRRVHITRVKGANGVKAPKSKASRRTIILPQDVIAMVADHLARYAAPGPDGLLFPPFKQGASHISHTAIANAWAKARQAAARPDLLPHDLRHVAATRAAETGATLRELMAFLGHSTPAMALRYQHAAQDRMALLSERLGEMYAASRAGDGE